MPSELNHQTAIVKDTFAGFPSAFAMKTSHRFFSGFPDLLIKIPGVEPCYVEVKKGTVSKGMVSINTTVLQRKTMEKMKKAGMKVCVWTVIEDGKDYRMLITPPECTKVVLVDIQQLPKKSPGNPWPIHDMIVNHDWEK